MMIINYQNLRNWVLGSWRGFLVIEILCMGLGFTYFFFAPKIYEADFAVRLPKVQVVSEASPKKIEWNTAISGLDYLRSMQNPLGYSQEFMQDCMGADTNQNRKDWVNALQIGLKNRGDIIQFSIRLEGEKRVLFCAKQFQIVVMQDLNGYYEGALIKAKIENEEAKKNLQFEKASVVEDIRLSDGFVRPNLKKILISSTLLGIFLTIFFSALQKKYRS